MKILIVGLGLMGGAYAYRLKELGYTVYGSDINLKSIEYAKNNNFIDDGSVDPLDFIEKSDIILIALYPKLILDFINKYHSYFNENQVITDLCGVKSVFVSKATKLSLPASYISHHPMAGKEKVGIEYAKECVFKDANFLIIKSKETNETKIPTIEKLGKDLGFKRISIMNEKTHDKMIGYTSQLTHALAVSLVNGDHDKNTKNYIGDSYRDLTRIANINENLWSELFLDNKKALIEHINSFEIELNLIKRALETNDSELLKEIFRKSTKKRKEMDK
ncbi:MAG: prephenate dehydrogenase [Acholeplasmatales bacterium]|nr:prephenate dehydrogenase [Acholeplasmatales bacterium]